MADTARPTHPLSIAEAWAVTAERARDSTFFFDFDGVLSPVTDDPDASQPVPAVPGVLEQLAEAVRRVAIVSARPVSFLRSRFASLERVDLYGLYGLEVWHDGTVVTEPAALPWVPAMADLAERARAELPPATLVEYKRLSVALHYRTAPHLAAVVEQWGHEQAERLGLRIQAGRMVVELNPVSEETLAEVRRWLTKGSGGGLDRGGSVFGRVVSVFVNPDIADADRVLRLKSQPFYRPSPEAE